MLFFWLPVNRALLPTSGRVRRYVQSKIESMRNKTPLLLIMFLTACASGPDQFSESLTNEFGLKEFTVGDLDDPNTKVKAAFIYTLLSNTEELRICLLYTSDAADE